MIVAEYTTAAGVHIAFADDAYAGCSAEELARRDMSEENIDQEDARELASRMDDYLDEFEQHGIDNVTIDHYSN